VEQSPSTDPIAVARDHGGGAVDPLDRVTDLDVDALTSGAGIFRGNATDGIVRASERFAAITGLPATVRGWDWLIAVHGDDRDRLRRAVDAACHNGARSEFTVRVQVRPGRVEPRRVRLVGTAVGDGAFGFVGSVEDPSARHAGADGVGVDDVDDPYRVVVDALPFPIAYAAADGAVEFVNRRWRECAPSSSDITAIFDDADLGTAVRDAIARGSEWRSVARVAGRVVGVGIGPVPAELGGGAVVTLTDAAGGSDAAPPTDALGDAPGDAPADTAADAPVAAFAALLDASLDYAAIVERDGPLLYLNPAARNLFGIADDASLAGVELSDHVEFRVGDDTGFAETARRSVREAGVHLAEGELHVASGGTRTVSMILLALTDGAGAHRATVCVARDASDVQQAEQRVIERERWYRALIQHAADAVAVLDADLSIRFASPACHELLGVDPGALSGPLRPDLVHPDDLAAVAEVIESVVQDGTDRRLRYRFRRPDGAERTVDTRFSNRLADPVIRGLVLNTRDVTEAEVANRARAAGAAAMRTVVRSAPAAILAVDLDGRITLWNPAAEELFGWAADEVLGGSVPFLSPDQTRRARAASVDLLDGREIGGEVRFRRRDGRPVTVAVSAAPVSGAEGEITEIVIVAVDVTDRARVDRERERRAELDRLVAGLCRDLLDASAETIETRTVDALERLAAQFGARAAELRTRDETPAAVWPVGAPALAVPASVPASGAFVVDGSDGSDGADPTAGWVIAGAQGPLGVVALAWDELPDVGPDDLAPLETVGAALIGATDRVAAERAVRESELRFRRLAEHATDFVVVVGADLQLRYLSPAASRFLGMTTSDRFDPADSVLHPDDQERVVEVMAAALVDDGADAHPLLARLRRADGEYRWVDFTVSNLLDEPTIHGLVLNGRDVTDRREMDELLRASESRFRGLVQNLAEGVTVLAADGSVKYSSPSAARMMGFDPGHGQGKLGLGFVVEDDRARAADIVGRAFTEPGIQGPISLRVHAANGAVRVVEALGHNRLDDPEVEGIVVTTRDITERVHAEEAARHSDARLSALVQNLSDVITVVAPDGTIAYTSPAAHEVFGFVEGDDSYVDPLARVHPDERDAVAEAFGEHLAGRSLDPVPFRLQVADGGWRYVEAVARDLTDDPAVGGIVVTTRDVTGRTRAELLVADQANLLTLIARGAPLPVTLGALCDVVERHVPDAVVGVLLVDPHRQILRLEAGPRVPVEIAEACHDVPVVGTEDVLGATVSHGASSVVLDVDRDPRMVSLRAVAQTCGIDGVWTTPIHDSDGRSVLGTIVLFLEQAREPGAPEREVVQMLAQTAAIAIERQSAEDLLAHRANHDLLTGLPNRGLFLDFLANALARSEREGTRLAVLFLDVDRFKHVNDGLGHDAGDVLLRELGARLTATVRPSDVVARFGGDEFTVLCDGLDPDVAQAQAVQLAGRLLAVVERPVHLDGEDRRLSASLGIAMAGPASTPDGLLHDADAAMYVAKQRGKARYEMFDDGMRAAVNERLDLEARLEHAIERQEFRLVVQPIVDLPSGRLVAGEALLRWQDPELGLVTPDAFIGLAEDTGLIIPIGEWALAEACRNVARWDDVGLLPPEFTMAVNLSARQVGQPDVVERVRAVLAASRVSPARICLEITESVLMEESSADAMTALKAVGVRLSIDDFGTGYSSLGYLKRFPVDSVKVDRSFVDGLGTEGEDSAIVAAVVSLGHALGLSVVAEGVETSGQLEELHVLGCDRAQGYWFSGPRTPGEFAGLVHAQPWIVAPTASTG
jgi:diguanylate cyclase (GGDEF)-like protein/PAS domain S-box-containing protein